MSQEKGGAPQFDGFQPQPITSRTRPLTDTETAAEGGVIAGATVGAAVHGRLQRKANLQRMAPAQQKPPESPNLLQPSTRPTTDTETAAEGAVIAGALRHASLVMPMLQQMAVLKHVDLHEEAAALGAELKEMVQNCHDVANGEAGGD